MDMIFRSGLFVLIVLVIGGCSGVKTFPLAARAGDTVAIPIGWYQELRREDLTLVITPSAGVTKIISSGDPALRAVANLYPDPVSRMVVARETNQLNYEGTSSIKGLLADGVTNQTKEWSETVVFVDLPSTLASGSATIEFFSNTGEAINPVSVEILSGSGESNTFDNYEGLLIDASSLAGMERASHYTVNFTGATIPYAVQVDFSHDSDVDTGGTGRAYVVNPRGDIKNVRWSDDGSNLKVMITPARGLTLSDINQLRFYVTGGISGLQVISGTVKAFDIAGSELMGISVNIE